MNSIQAIRVLLPTTNVRSCANFTRVAIFSAVLSAVVFSTLADLAHGAAFSQNNYDLGGDPKTAPYPNVQSNFFRWEKTQITYSFAPSFDAYYGLAGEGRVSAAFNTWKASLTANTGPADQSAAFDPLTDVAILGFSGRTFDLQSVALHEIGHAIGFDHPDAAANPGNNFNVVTGDWTRAALPAGSHPVMWSTIAPLTERQQLTLDDIYASQFLYAMVGPPESGAGQGPAGGPVFGSSAKGLNFVQIAYDLTATPDILINVEGIGTALASTLPKSGFFQGSGGGLHTLATHESLMTISFRAPEPSSMILTILGAASLGLFALRQRRKR